ncbi:MAG: aldo/keto reductase [Candidatus Marinimicrobia bacterium]|nr:aldo/keto reductase [Candidatus Neomarinimicrobiota bacterium]MCF7880641.1 aldo/keto reductase [Candidatus Neomarinimicrobiota bacterium]
MPALSQKFYLKKAGLEIPPIIFGTSSLGNLYEALSWEIKRAIVSETVESVEPPVVLDTAGKYGAGLALETIGKLLRELEVTSDDVLISNKLGWLRTPLQGDEPTFEPGVWKDLKHDARQDISYDGILRAWEQGAELLGEEYSPELVSVHDPDVYLAQATNKSERAKLLDDILGAYQALEELKDAGETSAVGVGSKDWKVIRELHTNVDLDWVMFANSFTVWSHPKELLAFMEELAADDVYIINSAVFHSGFLVGSNFFDYKKIYTDHIEHRSKFHWREKFFAICSKFNVSPAVACIQFGMSPSQVSSISLNTSKPERIRANIRAIQIELPAEFWEAMKDEGLIDRDYQYV